MLFERVMCGCFSSVPTQSVGTRGIAKCKMQIEQAEEGLGGGAGRGMVGNPAPRVAAAQQPWAVIFKPFRLKKHLTRRSGFAYNN